MENIQMNSVSVPEITDQFNAPQEPVIESASHFSSGLKIGLQVALVLGVGLICYFAGKLAKDNATIQPSVTPTPTPTASILPTPTPTETELPTPSVTEEMPSETPTVTETGTPSGTPVSTPTAAPITTKRTTFDLTTYSNIHSTQSYIIDVRSDVKATAITFNYVYNSAIVLQKGSKNFMLIVNPEQNSTDFTEQQGYSSAKLVSSDNFGKLYRVHAKKIFKSSGAYNFAIAYSTQDSLVKGDSCTKGYGNYISTTSPCAFPSATYSKGVASMYGVAAYCTIDPAYIPLCDQVMKTFEMKDTVSR